METLASFRDDAGKQVGSVDPPREVRAGLESDRGPEARAKVADASGPEGRRESAIGAKDTSGAERQSAAAEKLTLERLLEAAFAAERQTADNDKAAVEATRQTEKSDVEAFNESAAFRRGDAPDAEARETLRETTRRAAEESYEQARQSQRRIAESGERMNIAA